MIAGWEAKREVDGVPCREYWQRSDGAYVWYDRNTPYANPELKGARMWIAFGPEESILYRRKSNDRHRSPRRWKTAVSAMIAVDREFPVNDHKS